MKCPVKGHEHEVVKVRDHVQQTTGRRAAVWECPTGAYRWLVLEGRQLSDTIRMKKPRWGWKTAKEV